jgi:hypothetical protein
MVSVIVVRMNITKKYLTFAEHPVQICNRLQKRKGNRNFTTKRVTGWLTKQGLLTNNQKKYPNTIAKKLRNV